MAVLLLVSLIGLWSAAAQTPYITTTLLAGGTNNIAAATTNSPALVLDLTKSTDVVLQVSYVSLGTNVLDTTLVLVRSADGSTWSTINPHRIAVTGNGTNSVCLVTNLTVGATGWLKISSIEHPNGATGITNVSIVYGAKRL